MILWNDVALPRLDEADRHSLSLRRLVGLLRWSARALMVMHRARAERKALLLLDAEQLADIGMSADSARVEAMRAPWDLRQR